ncbi:MAG TPA: helix-turn-helix domain-containing protein [Alphaproteobacteria bacterium]|nr:helix-turn-helix domain-containing protein [Alphaproteobacteria bacterium]
MAQVETKSQDAGPPPHNPQPHGETAGRDELLGQRELVESTGGVRSVQRAFLLLQCLTQDRPETTLTEFAQKTGLATSTVQRLLNTLEAGGVLRRLPGATYTFGNALLQIAVIALGSLELHRLVEPHLDRLSKQTGETANFAVHNEDGDVLYLRQTLSDRSLRHAGWLGRAFPGKGTAIGAALAGQVDGDGVISSRDTLEPNVTAVAAPIYGPAEDGAMTIVGAINVTGPSFRIDDDMLRRYRALVATEARELTASIGGRWPDGAAAPASDDKRGSARP